MRIQLKEVQGVLTVKLHLRVHPCERAYWKLYCTLVFMDVVFHSTMADLQSLCLVIFCSVQQMRGMMVDRRLGQVMVGLTKALLFYPNQGYKHTREEGVCTRRGLYALFSPRIRSV